MKPLTELEKQGLVECDKCGKLMSEFGSESWSGDVFCYPKRIFNKHFHICLDCGNELFKFLE